jgi:hypothetical protein
MTAPLVVAIEAKSCLASMRVGAAKFPVMTGMLFDGNRRPML